MPDPGVRRKGCETSQPEDKPLHWCPNASEVRHEHAEHEEASDPAKDIPANISDRILQAERKTDHRQVPAIPQHVDIKSYGHDCQVYAVPHCCYSIIPPGASG